MFWSLQVSALQGVAKPGAVQLGFDSDPALEVASRLQVGHQSWTGLSAAPAACQQTAPSVHAAC